MISRIKKCVGLTIVITALALSSGYCSEPYNLRVSGVLLDQDGSVAPGSTVMVTYKLQANMALFGHLSMKIFIRSGPYGKWAKEWVLKPEHAVGMETPTGFYGRIPIQIPKWKDGRHYISVSANSNHFLGESNYNDNSMEIPIDVYKPLKNGLSFSKKEQPLGQPGHYPFTTPCGNNTLVVTLDHEEVSPGAHLSISSKWLHKVTLMPGIKLHMEADGGFFLQTGSAVYDGITDVKGVLHAQWQAPGYPTIGAGKIQHQLKISTVSSKGISCIAQVPVMVKW